MVVAIMRQKHVDPATLDSYSVRWHVAPASGRNSAAGVMRVEEFKMPLGPIELVIVEFPDDELHTELIPSVRALVEAGTVRIADLVFVLKRANGDVESIELADTGDDVVSQLTGLVDAFDGLLSIEDIDELGSSLEPGSSLLAVLFENTWAAPFVEASRKANGEVIFNERIPRTVIDELMA